MNNRFIVKISSCFYFLMWSSMSVISDDVQNEETEEKIIKGVTVIPGCESASCKNGTCLQIRHGVKCNCEIGYEFDEIYGCLDLDECAFFICMEGATCINSPGSFKCTCGPGYIEDMLSYTCVDYDECNDEPCGEYPCQNVNGSYLCLCPTGFVYNASVGCHDRDECDEEACQEIECNNTVGSFECICPFGFEYNSSFGCIGGQVEAILFPVAYSSENHYAWWITIALVFIAAGFGISAYVYKKKFQK